MNHTFDSQLLLKLIEKQQVFVAQDSNCVAIGFIIVSEKSGGAYIEEVDVLQTYGKRGIGKALIEQAFAWARKHGFKKMYLRTASNIPWNAPMYARLGFTAIPQNNWTDEMTEVALDEQIKGLPVADRVFMELDL